MNWKTMSASVVINKKQEYKTYGVVYRKDGRVIIRNYRRPLKNGKGLSLLDIAIERQISGQQRLLKYLARRVFA